jgi:hypothetical protein
MAFGFSSRTSNKKAAPTAGNGHRDIGNAVDNAEVATYMPSPPPSPILVPAVDPDDESSNFAGDGRRWMNPSVPRMVVSSDNNDTDNDNDKSGTNNNGKDFSLLSSSFSYELDDQSMDEYKVVGIVGSVDGKNDEGDIEKGVGEGDGKVYVDGPVDVDNIDDDSTINDENTNTLQKSTPHSVNRFHHRAEKYQCIRRKNVVLMLLCCLSFIILIVLALEFGRRQMAIQSATNSSSSPSSDTDSDDASWIDDGSLSTPSSQDQGGMVVEGTQEGGGLGGIETADGSNGGLGGESDPPISGTFLPQPETTSTEFPAGDTEDTEVPVVTESPAGAEEPSNTEAPSETEGPSETETPTDTEEPSSTEAPSETEQPSSTEEPSSVSSCDVIGIVAETECIDGTTPTVSLTMCISVADDDGAVVVTDQFWEWIDTPVEHQDAASNWDWGWLRDGTEFTRTDLPMGSYTIGIFANGSQNADQYPLITSTGFTLSCP